MNPIVLAGATAPVVNGGAKGMLSQEMLAPITSAVTNNVNLLVPVGITIMGIMIGVSLIPRIVYKFL